MDTVLNTANDSPAAAPAPATAPPAGPRCEAFAVRIGYVWLMVLLPVAGLVTGLINLVSAPSLPVLALAAALLALGYLAWRRGYRAVRLELGPGALRIEPAASARPATAIALPQIANYLRPAETYYQVLELQLHGGQRLRFSKRLRAAGPGLLTLDEWVEALATQLEEARPAAAAAGTTAAASGLVASPPRILARSVFGKVLAGLAVVWLLLAGLAALGSGQHVAGGVFLLPILYLGYFFRARGNVRFIVQKPQVLTGIKADKAIRDEGWADDNTAWMSND